VAACKGADEHKERRARQVEVRDQRVHRAKLIAGTDEEARPALRARGQRRLPASRLRRDALQHAYTRRADRDDAPARTLRGKDRGGGVGRRGEPLRVHWWIFW